jgi:methylaspartate mutase sigma subunit
MKDNPLFLLTTIESDSHTWNLVYIQCVLEEHHIDTINLGPCVPVVTTLDAMHAHRPDAVVISTVNGHGLVQGRSLLSEARRRFGASCPPMLIGGQLSTRAAERLSIRRELLTLGFSGVFVGDRAVAEFRHWLLQSCHSSPHVVESAS